MLQVRDVNVLRGTARFELVEVPLREAFIRLLVIGLVQLQGFQLCLTPGGRPRRRCFLFDEEGGFRSLTLLLSSPHVRILRAGSLLGLGSKL